MGMSSFDGLARSVLILATLPCPFFSSIFDPKGKSGKYTNYSDHTGITTTVGQSTIDSPTKACTNDMEDDVTVEGITLLIRNFANERQWYRYHTPRNIALAILGELGELAELFQWLGDGEGGIADEFSEEALDKVGQEIADVAIYLIRLCDVCRIRLGEVAMRLLDVSRATSTNIST